MPSINMRYAGVPSRSILRSDCAEEAFATSSNNVAVAPTVNFLFGRHAERSERRHKKKKIQDRLCKPFIFVLLALEMPV